MGLQYDDGGLRKYLDALPGAAGFLAIEGGVQAQSQVVLRHIKKNPGFTPRQAVGGLLDSFKVRKTSQKSRALTGAASLSIFQSSGRAASRKYLASDRVRPSGKGR